MLLAVDVGNTQSVFALCEGEVVRKEWRMRTDPHRTADEYGAWLLQLLGQTQWDASVIDDVIISSVVPDTLFPLKECCEGYFSCAPIIVGEASTQVPMRVVMERPSDAGADRLVNALAAWKRVSQACIIIDFGTATTFDVVNAKGEYCGGMIAPGVNLSLDALHQAAAKLPSIAIERPAKAIGGTTIEAMQSGVFYGYLGLIDGIIDAIRTECPDAQHVLATGGLSSLYGKHCETIDEIVRDLTIDGLIAIYNHNRSAA